MKYEVHAIRHHGLHSAVANTKSSRIRIMRSQSDIQRNLGLPSTTPGHELLYGFTCHTRRARRGARRVVRIERQTDSGEGGEGKEEAGAGEIPQGVVGTGQERGEVKSLDCGYMIPYAYG